MVVKTYTAADFKEWGAQGGAKSKRVLTAAQAFVSLDVEVFVAVKPAPFGNSIAAYTVHLTLSGQVLQ